MINDLHLNTRTRRGAVVFCALLIILIGTVDYVTGPEISFSLFYLIPVAFITWLAGAGAGSASAFLSALTLTAVEQVWPAHRSHHFIFFWNSMMSLGVFLGAAILLSKLKNLHQGLERIVAEKTLALSEEVNEHKRTEAMLREEEKVLDTIYRAVPVGICLSDEAGFFRQVNEAYNILYGYGPGELVGRHYHVIFPPEERPAADALYKRLLRGDTGVPKEGVRLCRDGSAIHVLAAHALIVSADGTKTVISCATDITERKRVEESLQKLSHAVEQCPVSIVITNLKGDIEFVNPKFCELTGYGADEALGQNPRLLKSGETSAAEYHALWETISTGGIWQGEFHNRKKNGEYFWEYATISPIRSKTGAITHYLGVKEDITHRKKLEEQLRHAQKMEAIGQLAGGIAHDFNNILTAIIGFGSLIEMKMAEDDPLQSNVQQILIAADRATHLTRGLLAYSRKQFVDLKQVDLNEILRRVEKFLARVIGEDIKLMTSFREEALLINADSSQIEQILMNLATNARDAMPEGGVLSIETDVFTIDETFNNAHGYGEPGRYALISVTDTGEGMDHETKRRLFDPFFTTKEVGKGTGLGLSIIYGIIKQHNGYVNVYSEQGIGTTFKIFLPLIAGSGEAIPEAAAAVPKGGSETILVAEDDESIRRLTCSVLREFGYTVIEAEDGEEAVKKFLEAPQAMDLLLLDMIMPKKSGKKAFDEIRRLHPDARALFISGYSNVMEKGELRREGIEVVTKPVRPQDLLIRVREILDSSVWPTK